jgi:hypothetical protein
MTRLVSVALVAILTVSCAPALVKLPALPSGPPELASDVREALADATSACRAVPTYSAEVAVSGMVRAQRLRFRMLVGLAAPSSARVEGVAPFGQPLFIFVTRADDATLLLPREDRVLQHGRPDAVLEALAGVPLDGADLRTTLTGCAVAPDIEGGRKVGDDWRVVRDGPTDVYLHRQTRAARWQIVSTVHHPRPGSGQEPGGDWRAEYGDFQTGLPRTVRLVSSDGKRFDLRLALSQVDINTALGDDVFRVQIPRSAQPMALDELRNARPGVRKD